jgi:hypothetical protein
MTKGLRSAAILSVSSWVDILARPVALAYTIQYSRCNVYRARYQAGNSAACHRERPRFATVVPPN